MKRITAFAALLCAGFAPTQAAELDCAEIGTVTSQNSSAIVVLNIHNASASPQTLNWISETGAVVEYTTIQPNRRVGQPVVVGNVWMIADAAGECLLLIAPEENVSVELTD